MRKQLKTSLNMRSIWVFSAIITILLIANAAKMVYSETDNNISDVIQEGIDQCGQLQNDACKAVMLTLNNICKVAYFEACFGDQWLPTMEELKKIYKHLQEDDYVTINNEHYGHN